MTNDDTGSTTPQPPDIYRTAVAEGLALISTPLTVTEPTAAPAPATSPDDPGLAETVAWLTEHPQYQNITGQLQVDDELPLDVLQRVRQGLDTIPEDDKSAPKVTDPNPDDIVTALITPGILVEGIAAPGNPDALPQRVWTLELSADSATSGDDASQADAAPAEGCKE